MGANSRARDARLRNARPDGRGGRGFPSGQPPCDCPDCRPDPFGRGNPFGRGDASRQGDPSGRGDTSRQGDAFGRGGAFTRGSAREKDRGVDEQIRVLLTDGIQAYLAGRSPITAVSGLCRLPVAVVDQALDLMLKAAVSLAWESGWQPAELYDQGMRLGIGTATMTCLIGAITLQMAAYADATIDPRWSDQLEIIEAAEWWPRDRTFFGSFATRLVGSRESALHSVIEVGAMLTRLPRIERLLPLPGTARSSRPVSPANVDAKVLGRIRALLAKAESTEFPEEAEALSAKAQELMTRFSLDHALLEATAPQQVAPTAAAIRMWLDAPYVKAKSRLVSAVARANRCRTVFTSGLDFATVMGDDVDLQLVQVLATSLLVQAGRAMLVGGSRTGRQGESRTRAYRQSFLVAYADRIGERLAVAEKTSASTVETADAERLFPVLAAREARVKDLSARLFPNTSAMRISVSDTAGYRDGRAAADRASLDTAKRALRG